MVRDLHASPSFARDLALIALGHGERGDDDRFAAHVSLLSGRWGVGTAAAEPEGAGPLFASGVPMRRIGEIASVEPVGMEEHPDGQPDTLWLVCEGPNVGDCLRRPPSEPKREALGPISDKAFEYRIQVYRATRLLKLSHCEDTSYLWHVLGRHMLNEIGCRSAKSIRAPKVSAAVLADTFVPWPPAETRAADLGRIDTSGKLALSSELRRAVEDLANEHERLKEFFDDDDTAPMTPELIDWAWSELIEAHGELSSLLESKLPQIVGKDWKSKWGLRSAPEPKHTPAPIAYIKRLLEAEDVPARRLRHAIDLADVTLRLEGFVILGLLSQVDPDATVRVWSQVSRNRKQQNLSMGHWVELVRGARKTLRVINAQMKGRTSTFAGDVLTVDDLLIDKLASAIVQLRNESHGHGYALKPGAERAVADECRELSVKLVHSLPHLHQYPLLYLKSRRLLRDRTDMKYCFLTGENPYFVDSQPQTYSRGLRLDTLPENEVYVRIDEPDVLVPLTPWVLFEPSQKTDASVWLFDGVKPKGPAYMSPHAPDEKHIRPDLGAVTLGLMGL